jgi:alpha-tubulin suppressor-like RCC1 family protein
MKGEKVEVSEMKCGNNHCIALLDINEIVVWGGSICHKLYFVKR